MINGHFDTVIPALTRKVQPYIKAKKFTINTADHDFFDLDYYDVSADKTIIISHGLEGNSVRPYMLGMANAFVKVGWNAISWNYRGCNGKTNNSIRSYHSGFTDDLIEVIHFAKKQPHIRNLVLIGFSLGGNITLRYLAGTNYDQLVRAAVVFSVPLNLHDSCIQISKGTNWLYSKRFLKSLKQKIKQKAKAFPELDRVNLKQIQDLKAFDDHYTAPMHGFKNAIDYYESCSAIYVLDQVKTPTLIINALNDPFLPPSCYPTHLLADNQKVFMETPKRGGHVGFY
jgi:hypothetical protein